MELWNSADNQITFEPFPKMARLSRDIVITEKIDGTNAQVIITDDGQIGFASRTRLLSPEKGDDNMGFGVWGLANKDELLKLGPGRHFGEWWGGKIQRGYGLKEKRFSLFNTGRWNAENTPSCCLIVPVLYSGLYSEAAIEGALETLRHMGSVAAPGFMDPEGIVIYHTAAGFAFKKTLKNDEKPKGSLEKG